MAAERCSTWMKSVAGKKHLHQLSRGCYVYGRDGDADDTLVIRDFYTTDKFVVFGVKSVEKIEKMYAAIWDCSEKETSLAARCEFEACYMQRLFQG